MQKRYEALDGLRGVAALAVMWLHCANIFGWASVQPKNAHLAVDFFFALSGFVVAHAYERKLLDGMEFHAFLRERLIRLMPLAILGTLLGGAVLMSRAILARDVSVSAVLGATALNTVLLPASTLLSVNPGAYPTNPPLWSLSFELVVNMAFALVALRLTTRRLVALLIVAGGLTIWTALANHGLHVGFRWGEWYLGCARVLFPFACGVLLRRTASPANRLAVPLALGLGAFLMAPAVGAIGEALAVLVLFPAIVAVGAGATVGARVGAACALLGRLSYPLYIIHHPIIRVIKNGAERLEFTNAVAIVLLAFVVSISAALVAERADRIVRAWLKRPQATADPAARAA